MPVNRLDRDALSHLSGRASNAGLSIRGSQRSKVPSVAQMSRASKRPKSQCATSTASRMMTLRKTFQEKPKGEDQASVRTAVQPEA